MCKKYILVLKWILAEQINSCRIENFAEAHAKGFGVCIKYDSFEISQCQKAVYDFFQPMSS
jgi:hypothetical protein